MLGYFDKIFQLSLQFATAQCIMAPATEASRHMWLGLTSVLKSDWDDVIHCGQSELANQGLLESNIPLPHSLHYGNGERELQNRWSFWLVQHFSPLIQGMCCRGLATTP